MRLGKHQIAILKALYTREIESFWPLFFLKNGKPIYNEPSLQQKYLREIAIGQGTNINYVTFSRALKGLREHGLVEVERKYDCNHVLLTEKGMEALLQRSKCQHKVNIEPDKELQTLFSSTGN